MDGHRRPDAMTEPLDREIESMLAVDPSPEFVARVRARVAEEPEPGGRRSWWMLTVAGAVAAVILAVIVWPSHGPAPLSDAPVKKPQIAVAEPPVSVPEARPLFEPSVNAPEARPVVRQSARSRVAPLVATPPRPEIELPQVIVAENEARAFASLIASVRQRHFDVPLPVPPDPDTRAEVTEMRELPPVIIEPLEIEPIVKLATLE